MKSQKVIILNEESSEASGEPTFEVMNSKIFWTIQYKIVNFGCKNVIQAEFKKHSNRVGAELLFHFYSRVEVCYAWQF